MITHMLPGLENLSSWDLITTSPLNHPLRALFSVTSAILCTTLAMKILKNVKTGITLQAAKNKPYLFHIHKGKISGAKKSKNILLSYNTPAATAALGLFIYIAANILIILAFKTIRYYFTY